MSKRDERTARIATERKRLKNDFAFSLAVVLAWARQQPLRERMKMAWVILRGAKRELRAGAMDRRFPTTSPPLPPMGKC